MNRRSSPGNPALASSRAAPMQDLLIAALETVIEFLRDYNYFAIFSILILCGLGLPLPEEVTLVASGLLVGWGETSFLPSVAVCMLGILVGDSIIFGLGHRFGEQFLRSRPMRFILPPRRRKRVATFFRKHGRKTVFFARFFAGIRVGVYAYAGSQRMGWLRFWWLDFLGAFISVTLSVWIAMVIGRKYADSLDEAKQKAFESVRSAGHWIVLGALVLIAVYAVSHLVWNRIRDRRSARNEAP